MKISEVSARTGLADSSIRYYERMGLLKPVRNAESSYREFTEEDVKVLMQIIVLRRSGVSVSTVSMVIKGEVKLSDVIGEQKKELAEASKKIDASIRLCQRLESEESIEDMDTLEYFRYTEEEVSRGNRYTYVEELMDNVSMVVQDAFYDNPMILSFVLHPRYRYVFFLFYLILIPLAILINGIVERSYVWILVCILLYAPIITAYYLRKPRAKR